MVVKETHEQGNTQPVINASDATIQQRQVTIRVLTVGTRQITQALYKQLPEDSVIDEETGTLKGDTWGWVNLHDGHCNEKVPHFHAIWEVNGQLRRACTYQSSNWYPRRYRDHLMSQLCDLATIYILFTALADRRFTNWEDNDRYLSFIVKGLKVRAHIPDAAITLWRAPERIKKYRQYIAEDQSPEYYQKQIDEVMGNVKSLKKAPLYESFGKDWDTLNFDSVVDPEQYTSYEQVYAEMERGAEIIHIRDHKWAESYNTIEQAGQLFIAVSGVWK